MDAYSVLWSIFVGFITLVVIYVLYMSKDYGIFRKMGVKALTPFPAVGSFPIAVKMGIFGFHKTMYKRFENEKVYGYFEAKTPILVIRDLDMLKEIMVKNHNSFVNRRIFTSEEPINHALTVLEDEQWRHVRNTVSPTFSSGKLKKMCLLVEETAKSLTSNLRKTCQEDKEIELKHLIGCYTMDVIANTGFGITIDSLNDESSPFVREAKNIMSFGDSILTIILMFPMVVTLLNKLGYTILPKKSVNFFNSFVDAAMETRRSEESGGQKRHDFIQLMAEEEKKRKETSSEGNTTPPGGEGDAGERQERKGLSRLEIQGQAFIFILAGYDTVSTALSFTLFILAHKPDITHKIQEELDEVLAGKPPTYDNVNSLVYLDMCLNEGIRMYPPGFVIDRKCTQECELGGVKIPKGMTVVFPFYAIFNDPELFPNPEEFDPERFTPENKASRHPFSFLPFGQGPRNCIGMRLALMEMKIALASVLQEMTPVPCSKSVYPPKLGKFQLKAEDGLWVKFESRKHE